MQKVSSTKTKNKKKYLYNNNNRKTPKRKLVKTHTYELVKTYKHTEFHRNTHKKTRTQELIEAQTYSQANRSTYILTSPKVTHQAK